MGYSTERCTSSGEEPTSVDEKLYRISYASTQTAELQASDLIEMLQSARAHNEAKNITGVLLHRQDSFLQIIEGEENAVRDLFEKISKDPRHQRVELLAGDVVEEREFSDWQMGFVELDGVDVSMLPGFSNFLNEDDDSRTVLRRLSQTRRLMLLFKSLG